MLVRLYDFHPFPPRNHALHFLRKFFPLRLPSAVPVFDICKIDLFFHDFSPSPLSYSYYTTSVAVVQVFNQWFLGGKKTASSLARQRLMRGDKSPLSSFDLSTPVNPAPLLLIGIFYSLFSLSGKGHLAPLR